LIIQVRIDNETKEKKFKRIAEARVNKLLEQFAILSNTLPKDVKIKLFFATAYNRYGEGKPWRQERVRQYFADDELLIGKDFWGFVCKSDKDITLCLTLTKKVLQSILAM